MDLRKVTMNKLENIFESLSSRDFNDSEIKKIKDFHSNENIELILSDSWNDSLLTFPKIIEKNIYNKTIKEAKTSGIERTWDSSSFRNYYIRNSLKIVRNLSINKNANDLLSKIKDKMNSLLAARHLALENPGGLLFCPHARLRLHDKPEGAVWRRVREAAGWRAPSHRRADAAS